MDKLSSYKIESSIYRINDLHQNNESESFFLSIIKFIK